VSRQVFAFPLRLTMSIAAAWQQCLAFFGTPIALEPSPGQLSGDAGRLPLRPFDANGNGRAPTGGARPFCFPGRRGRAGSTDFLICFYTRLHPPGGFWRGYW
jgi:hypothetical protein